MLLDTLREAADAVRAALDAVTDWGVAATIGGHSQYHFDLIADAAALPVLHGAGLGTLSEESGVTHGDRPVIAVLDPVDGSTNASRGIPWFATSICVVDGEGPSAALVVNQATGQRFEATRGGGATCDGEPIRSSSVTELDSAILGVSGFPRRHLGWRQYRALGSIALDLCAVAAGRLDGFVDLTRPAAHAPWDYMAGLLVSREAGAAVADAGGEDLVVLDPTARRSPFAAGSQSLFEALGRKIPEID